MCGEAAAEHLLCGSFVAIAMESWPQLCYNKSVVRKLRAAQGLPVRCKGEERKRHES